MPNPDVVASLETVEAAKRGESAALDTLIGRHLPAIRAFVRLQAGAAFRARESCSDLVQTACRQALANLHEFEWRGEESFRHWLFAVTANKLQNHMQYHRAACRDVAREQRDTVALRDAYCAVTTPSQDAIGHEFAERLEEAMDQLPEHYREVILLARVVELPHGAIAVHLGIREEAVRTRLVRARARLATLLDLGLGPSQSSA
jgi:RNA polymerase sigma-70 factor, ECF subfamily